MRSQHQERWPSSLDYKGDAEDSKIADVIAELLAESNRMRQTPVGHTHRFL